MPGDEEAEGAACAGSTVEYRTVRSICSTACIQCCIYLVWGVSTASDSPFPSDIRDEPTDFTPNCNFHASVMLYSLQTLRFRSILEQISVVPTDSLFICVYLVGLYPNTCRVSVQQTLLPWYSYTPLFFSCQLDQQAFPQTETG